MKAVLVGRNTILTLLSEGIEWVWSSIVKEQDNISFFWGGAFMRCLKSINRVI